MSTGIDYYGVLKVRKPASEDEVKNAYRRLAMKWHPDTQSAEDKETVIDRFKNITIAYEVLIDAEKRRAYDEGRELEAALDCGSEGASIDHAMEVFAGVFGFRSPLEIDAEKRAGFEGALEKVFSSALELGSAPEVTSKAPPIERKLLCTLKELYNGSSRKVKITRTHTDAHGRAAPVEETLTIEVMPGWMAGTRVVFPGKGNSKAGVLPSDVVLVIEEKPHEVLRREGDDLIIVMKVPLVDALTGYTAPVETLDGRLLMVPCVDVLKPSSEVIVKHEGMPICSSSSTITSSSSSSAHDLHPDSPTAIATIAASDRRDRSGKHQHGIKPLRGDLRLHFHIVFPDQLSAAQKAAVRHALVDLK